MPDPLPDTARDAPSTQPADHPCAAAGVVATSAAWPAAGARRRTWLRRLALLCLLLVVAVTSLSAFMRHRAAGLGCAPWPACYAQGLRALQQGVPRAAGEADAVVAAARAAHRVAAVAALVLVLAMLGLCWGGWPVLGREGLLAGALLALALFLAGLGVLTPGARVPAVAMGNLLGGFLMLGLSARLALAPGAAPALGFAAAATAALLLLQISSGALVSASYAGLSCDGWADCAARAAASGGDLRLLDPWREPLFDAAARPPNPDGALAQALHRLGGVLLLPVLVLLGVAARRRGRERAGAALIGLALLQVALGIVIATFGLPLAAVLAHNLVAAWLLALLLRLV